MFDPILLFKLFGILRDMLSFSWTWLKMLSKSFPSSVSVVPEVEVGGASWWVVDDDGRRGAVVVLGSGDWPVAGRPARRLGSSTRPAAGMTSLVSGATTALEAKKCGVSLFCFSSL